MSERLRSERGKRMKYLSNEVKTWVKVSVKQSSLGAKMTARF